LSLGQLLLLVQLVSVVVDGRLLVRARFRALGVVRSLRGLGLCLVLDARRPAAWPRGRSARTEIASRVIARVFMWSERNIVIWRKISLVYLGKDKTITQY
jgi:hypothetical protein